MGVRSYVPQLGRFLQPDPNPGGSANAYAYTYGNPLNESDPSGEFPTYDGDGFVGEGEGLHGEGAGAEGSGLAVGATGAIVPPSAQAQEEEANEEFALYEDAGAGSEEYEEYEEEGGEEVSYHPGTTGQSEAHAEEGLLYQPLAEGQQQGQPEHSGGMSDCEETAATRVEPCTPAVEVFSFSEALGALKKGWHALKQAGGAVLKKAVKFGNWLRRESCLKLNYGLASACQIHNTASSCEAAGDASWLGGFLPASKALTWLLQGGGLAVIAKC